MFEAQPGACDEVAHGARHNVSPGAPWRPRGAAVCTAMPPISSRANRFRPCEGRCAPSGRAVCTVVAIAASAPHRASRAVEGGEKPRRPASFTLATKPTDLLAHGCIVAVEQRAPTAGRLFGRRDRRFNDVGE